MRSKEIAKSMRVLRWAAAHSVKEFFAIYPLKTYLVAWLPRVGAQIAFFALYANFVGGTQFLRYALVGNAVYLMALTAITTVTASVTWEKRAGTLPLLVASPSSPLLVLSGRNVGMGLHGLLTGAVGLFVIAPLMGLPLTLLGAVLAAALLLIVAVGAYAIGLLLGAVAVHTRGIHNFLSNLLTLTMLCISGVNVPLDQLPIWAAWIGYALPVTHGLQAVRLALAGAPLNEISVYAALELVVAVCYLLAAQWLFWRMLRRSRLYGTVDIY